MIMTTLSLILRVNVVSWLHVFRFHHCNSSIDPPIAYDEQGFHGYIAVTLRDRYRGQSKRVLCLGSMTIKKDSSRSVLRYPDHDILYEHVVLQNHGWWEQSAKEGETIEGQLVVFDNPPPHAFS